MVRKNKLYKPSALIDPVTKVEIILLPLLLSLMYFPLV